MKRRVILCGAGHSNLYIASRARDFSRRDTELLVIDPGTFWYSGMATGLLSGRYTPDQDCIDVARLVHSAGGKHLPDRVNCIDPSRHTLHTAGGQEIRYDLVSLNIGSSVAPVPPGADHANVWPVKPISNLLGLHRQLMTSLQSGRPEKCLVLGGGSTGSEAAGNLAALFRRHGMAPEVRLVTGDARLCTHLPERASKRIASTLEQRGVGLSFGTRIGEIDDHTALSESGESFRFDHLVLATGLRAQQMKIDANGSPQDPEADGMEVDARLLSTAYPDLFASGDCARMRGHRLPKIGVFGVRQAPILHHNLLAKLDGGTLQSYTPQKTFLSILNLGESEALAVRGKLWWFGRSSMWLKEWLDRRFVSGYQTVGKTRH